MEGLGLNVAEGRDRWRAVVYAVTNLRVYKVWGNCWPAEELLDSQEGRCWGGGVVSTVRLVANVRG